VADIPIRIVLESCIKHKKDEKVNKNIRKNASFFYKYRIDKI
jgi:hypothetical protein